MQSNPITDDLRIREIKKVMPPEQAHSEFPITDRAVKTVSRARQGIHDILTGQSDRLVVVIGPCSIHDTNAAIDYAKKLLRRMDDLRNDLLIVMRVYFEKPRTTVGWKGLINDPDLDESFNINRGLRLARKLLLDINEWGIPVATEYLDLITPQYVSDLIGWGAIGARTTESQAHRQLASGLSCPVGFKNATDGSIKVAVDAIGAARQPHHFLSVTKAGHSAIFSTTGNEDCHVILRGGVKTNYDETSVANTASALHNANLSSKIMIDFSHANSLKQHERQKVVGKDVAAQIAKGDERIFGVMIESHLIAGSQKVIPGEQLVYGQSITDACLGWDASAELLTVLAKAVKERRIVLKQQKNGQS